MSEKKEIIPLLTSIHVMEKATNILIWQNMSTKVEREIRECDRIQNNCSRSLS